MEVTLRDLFVDDAVDNYRIVQVVIKASFVNLLSWVILILPGARSDSPAMERKSVYCAIACKPFGALQLESNSTHKTTDVSVC